MWPSSTSGTGRSGAASVWTTLRISTADKTGHQRRLVRWGSGPYICTQLWPLGQTSKLLISTEYVNETEKIGGTWTDMNSYRKKWSIARYFHVVICWYDDMICEIFYDTMFYFKIFKAVSEITARQTWTNLCKTWRHKSVQHRTIIIIIIIIIHMTILVGGVARW